MLDCRPNKHELAIHIILLRSDPAPPMGVLPHHVSEDAMDFPDFFTDVPTITLRDQLAVFLGASRTGVMRYAYADAVKLAGHSCPTVAGAYLMVRRGLQYLYGSDMPERGGVEVYLRDPRDQGTTGVIAAVATLITGAAPETGFGGIGAHRRFGRRDLLHFDAPIEGLMALGRRDNGRGVILDLDTSVVPAAREMQVQGHGGAGQCGRTGPFCSALAGSCRADADSACR